ncbi:MAG: ABC transporter substrate-binding protein [Aliidongia sp.]
MNPRHCISPIRRRAVLKSALALGATRLAGPFVIAARGEQPIRIGFVTPLIGTYGMLGKNEAVGAQYAVDQLNAAGGILNRPVELLVEDSTSGEISVAVQKTAKLIRHDQASFILGNVNSALAMAMGQMTHELGTLHIVTGAHLDALTGTECRWNLFRVCSTTQMQADSIAAALIRDYGRRWFYITPDYAYGRALQGALEKAAAKHGGTKVGAELMPLGTTDFAAALSKARDAKPDVLMLLMAGDDSVNALTQSVQLGLPKHLHIAGALQELEVLDGLPPSARIGSWVFEWYWNRPDVPHLAEFVDGIRQKTGKVPTARNWFGFAAAMSCGLIANQENTLEPIKLARALAGFTLPPEVALAPGGLVYRAADHQLLAPLFVGTAQDGTPGSEDLFKVATVIDGTDTALPAAATGCKPTWPR